ncbi:PD40 domain-containing protein [Candidatus Poribacteria bacterium]|nr:PD40 domain-containing protein [Candidatus Poribacteria bacterium]
MKPLIQAYVCCLLLLIPTLTFAKILFKSHRDGGDNIYVMDDDGTNVQRLTNTQRPRWDAGPVWSPDGKQIAFFRNIPKIPNRQHPRLFIMDQDGSNEKQITEVIAGNCTWAPDGRRIAFEGDSDIRVIDIVTREIQVLTRNRDVNELTANPAWSPNGKYIAYRQTLARQGTTIYVMKSDGTDKHPLVPRNEWVRYHPRWSLDSKSVLYFETLNDPDLGFKFISSRVVIQEHGLINRRILKTPEQWVIHGVCWFDNGKQVLISAEEYGAKDRQIEIYKYHLANDQITNITNNPEDDWAPDWISDNILPVSPVDKKEVQWGKLKVGLKNSLNLFGQLFHTPTQAENSNAEAILK